MATVALAGRPFVLAFRFTRRRPLIIVLAAVVVVCGYWFWFRDSALVAVDTVKVEGVAASEPGLEDALIAAGKEMTTLHVRPERLQDVAKDYPDVESIAVNADFPSTLIVKVTRRDPVALIGSGGSVVAVADDGTILESDGVQGLHLPELALKKLPKAGVIGGPVLQEVTVLAEAPKAFLPYLVRATRESGYGVVVELGGGVDLRFRDDTRAADKWQSAAAVLSDEDLGPLDYVDLSAPDRPTVGGTGHTPPPLSGP